MEMRSSNDGDDSIDFIWDLQSHRSWLSVTSSSVLGDAVPRPGKTLNKAQIIYASVDFAQTRFVVGLFRPGTGGEPTELTPGYDWQFFQPLGQKEHIETETQNTDPVDRDLEEENSSYDEWLDDFLDAYTADGVVKEQKVEHDIAHCVEGANRTACDLIEVFIFQLRN
ncbi:hypothetical protein BS50DRAFT_593508 [Corynespora cassiicola Philippines]|uniref:Uncharacterized protein n=1 Tax=Corynespora cassiicola Philippines TaxID=1448308 RepID=A0A2T2N5P6_CORCC|nr:hypothetical protein BS50DRAFT_593508 [Corynespora cassiicola Philippines]